MPPDTAERRPGQRSGVHEITRQDDGTDRIPPERTRRGDSRAKPWTPADLPSQLSARITVSPGGCWIVNAHHDRDGYAQIWWNRGSRRAHRVAYEFLIGPIPVGMTLDHVWARGCRSKACCNVVHLEAVSQAENNRRARERKRHYKALDEAWGDLARLTEPSARAA